MDPTRAVCVASYHGNKILDQMRRGRSQEVCLQFVRCQLDFEYGQEKRVSDYKVHFMIATIGGAQGVASTAGTILVPTYKETFFFRWGKL